MDHLPKSLSSTLNSPSIPYLGSEFGLHYPKEAQGWAGFKAFPENKGFDLDDTVKSAARCRRSAAFLQSWLFFGLLREVFSWPNYNYSHDHFIRTTNSGQIITTKALTRYAWYWQAARVHDHRDTIEELTKGIDQYLGFAHRVGGLINHSLISHPQTGNSNSEWSTEVHILFSIALVGDFLSTARVHLRQYSPGHKLNWEFAPVEQLMQDGGWCVGEISMLRDSCGLSSRYYLAGINRHVLGKKHNRCNPEVGCLANQLDYNTYRTSHHHGCDRQACVELGPLEDDIVSAIRTGATAVVDATNINQGQHARVAQVDGAQRYVAISHVWSDGLGNPWNNRLNLCQLNRIQNLVNSLYEPDKRPVHFWIDSLSIPVGKAYAKERQLAIARIGQTFQDADKVLVLDNSLELLKGDFELVEALMRIRYAPWMTRVWTLLEGNLAQNLYFQFGDKVEYGQDLTDPRRWKSPLTVHEALRELSDEEIRLCPSAMQLVQALATERPDYRLLTYEGMEEQSDLEEEGFRLDALQILREKQDDYEIGQKWRARFEYLDTNFECDTNDEFLKSDIDVRTTCPVLLHASDSVSRVRGIALRESRNGRNTASSVKDVRFKEACSGLRARTTSRLDDEPVCLGAMLGIDLKPILDIPTMNWRLREWLDSMDSQRSRSGWVKWLGINTRRFTDECHLKRMEVLLLRVDEFPLSIIFWNIARLESHTWAPQSLLDRSLVVDFSEVQGDCKRSQSGLELKMSAHRLGNRQTRQQLGNKTGVQGEVLTIIPQEQIGGTYATSWCQVMFVANDRTIASEKERSRTWQDYINQGDIDNLAVIFRSDLGALVRILDTDKGVHIVQHVRLLKKAPVSGTGPAIGDSGPTIGGTWMNEADWCFR